MSKLMPISAMLPSIESLCDQMDDKLYGELPDGSEGTIEAADGAELALQVWADTYLKYTDSKPLDVIRMKKVAIRITSDGWEQST
jgi:hypothetical protein